VVLTEPELDAAFHSVTLLAITVVIVLLKKWLGGSEATSAQKDPDPPHSN
jgi:ABC-type Fe3+ transport system permease subunit